MPIKEKRLNPRYFLTYIQKNCTETCLKMVKRRKIQLGNGINVSVEQPNQLKKQNDLTDSIIDIRRNFKRLEVHSSFPVTPTSLPNSFRKKGVVYPILKKKKKKREKVKITQRMSKIGPAHMEDGNHGDWNILN